VCCSRPSGDDPATGQQLGQRVARALHLSDRVDAVLRLAAALVPGAAIAGDVPTLDLDRRQTDPGPRDEGYSQ